MGVERHIRLFNSIARPYAWFHTIQTRRYLALIKKHFDNIGLHNSFSVLDVGCGPGSFGVAFKRFGYSASGVDGSAKMAEIALSNGLECSVADATVRLPYPDHSVDLVTAAYLAHGFEREHRAGLFGEMRRVARKLVLLHDFSPSAGGFPPVTIAGILELLEGSDYVNFRQHCVEELESVFSRVQVLPINKRLSWYICS